MKKILTALLILLLISFIPLNVSAEPVEKETGYVAVNFSTIKEISPNQAEITIKIETSDKSLQKASDDNKNIAKLVYSSLKSLLGANDYIKTSNYSAKPQYFYKDNKRVFDKYLVSNNVVVKTKNTDLVSKLIDTAIAKGATNIEDLQFSTSDYENECNATLAELTKKSWTEASAIAGSINSKIVGVKSINATCSSDNAPRPYYAMMAKGMEDNAVPSTPIESGKVKINVNIDASFYVK